MILVPIRTAPGQNAREQHFAKARRVRMEKQAVGWSLIGTQKPPLPCSVRLTRCSPSHVPLDDDNLSGALKAARDAIAAWLGVDDGDRSMVQYVYAQKRAPWGVTIEFGERVAEAEFVPLVAK